MNGEAKGGREVATLGGGCFWCLEPIFRELEGVVEVTVGYSGGRRPNPTYEQVCTGATGHAEAVQVAFDPSVISFRELLEVFFGVHDPTTPNRQGADLGTQYRSAIFFHGPEQEAAARGLIRELDGQGLWDGPIVTEVVAFEAFYPAEAYHQDYFRKNPGQGYCRVVVAPKLAKFRQRFAGRAKGRA